MKKLILHFCLEKIKTNNSNLRMIVDNHIELKKIN